MEDIFRLDGKNAVVIGGAGGIGEAIAKGLAFYGAEVAIASRNLEKLNKVSANIKKEINKEIKYFQVDVTDEKSVQDLVQTVNKEMGGADILVNSQGINPQQPLFEFDMELFDRMFAINVRGVMICCKEFGKEMAKKKWGRIINLTSVRGKIGAGVGTSVYCATKGAVNMLIRDLCKELAPHNITINGIAPTVTDTPLMSFLFDSKPGIKEIIAKNHPIQRISVPEDMIGAAVYLASEAAKYVTGAIIYTDGGLTAVG